MNPDATPTPEEVHDWFVLASALPQAERPAWLRAHCGHHPALQALVEALLSHDALGDQLLDRPVWHHLARAVAPDAMLRPGDLVGGYTLHRALGGGGQSRVFAARAPDGAEVALKLVSLPFHDDGASERLTRQAQRARSVRHPHLVEILDLGADREARLWFCAMRLVPGPMLDHVLTELVAHGPPRGPQREALLSRGAEVASALCALHQAGLVHRDVKPANIVLEGTPQDPTGTGAVLVDFGTLRGMDAPGQLSSLWVSRHYAAPELLLTGRADARSDLFSLGVTMHDLLSARTVAQRRRAPSEGLEPIRQLVADLDPRVADVIDAACEPDPRRRPARAELVEQGLRGTRGRTRLRARAANALRATRRDPARAVRRARPLLFVALACVLAFVLGQLSLVATTGPHWQQARPAHCPEGREVTAMAFHAATRRTVLFGGTRSGAHLHDTWTWDGQDWTECAPATWPPGRGGHAMAYDPVRARLVMHGGRDSDLRNDTWEWDGSTWRDCSTARQPPAAPHLGMAYDPGLRRTVVVLKPRTHQPWQVWTWDGTEWQERTADGGPGVTDFSLALDPGGNRLLAFGGQGSDGTWLLEWQRHRWIQHLGPSPGFLGNAGLVCDPDHRRVVLVGGYSGVQGPLGGTWFFAANAWHRGPDLAPRGEPAIAYDTVRHRVVVFGGVRHRVPLTDTWELP